MAAKATKSVGAKSKTAKPAAKANGKAGKAEKPAVKAAAKSAKAPAKAEKPAKAAQKAELKTDAKPAKAGKAEKAPKAAAPVAAKPAAKKAPEKIEKKPAKEPKKKADISDAEASAQAMADDLLGDTEAPEESYSADQEEENRPSALLQAMRPNPVDPDKAEKKKKKDDLKIDRTGDIGAQWAALKEKHKALKPVAYKMSERYEARTPILHKVLGWGFIITNLNDRLEVIFQDEIKFLISNYRT